MRGLNQDFRYYRAFSILTLTAIIIFLALFAKSMLTAVEVFETGIYTNTVADLSQINNPN
jgi:hypothetical protein